MNRKNHRIFLAGILSFVFFFSFFQSSQAGFFDWFKWFRKSTPQNTTEVVPGVKKTSNSSNSWKTYRNEEYGFEFKYPNGWDTTFNLSYTEGANYKVIAKVVNPDRAGVPDTDVPIEVFLVRSLNYPCKGKTTNLTGRTGTDTGWEEGFGNIYYRTLCIKTEGWPITITLSAYDQPSRVIMERILSTFKFIESSSSSSLLPISKTSSKTNSSKSSGASSKDKLCAQVVTSAKNKITGKCKEFSNACIPSGWEKVGVCDVSKKDSSSSSSSSASSNLSSSSSSSNPSITVIYPNGGEVFTEDSQVNIRWNTNGLSSSQKLNIVLNVGSSGMGETIAKDVINNGSYLWTAKPFESFYSPEGGSQIVLSGKYTISVVCSQQNYATCKFNRNFDTSDSVFMITKQSSSAPLSITVQVPNGGEVWGDNHSEYIYFTSNLSKQPLKIWAQNTQSGLVTIVDESYVTIDSKSNRAGWSPSRAPLAAGSYKICVGTDIRNPLDCSDAVFAVVSSANTTTPSITVIPPNKEEALIASTTTSQEIKISRDAKRIADINNLMLALELYFDIKREYPLTASWKTDLAPTYIGTIPKDPLTADYTYERCTPTLYHLGTALEEATNSKLTNNNKTAVSGCSGAWGSNTSVCSGVPGLNQGYFCYDVKP